MQGERNQSSVRVEIESSADGQALVPDAPGADRNRRPLLIGLLALAAAAGLVLLALPDGDRGLVGEPADPFVDSFADTSTTSSTTPESTTTVAERLGIERTSLNRDVVSVVEADRGWIALVVSNSRTQPPQLHRSLDGREWTQIDVTLDVEPVEGGRRNFSLLTRDDRGFAMVMVTSSSDDLAFADEGHTVRIDRLVSTFGAEWAIDPEFEPVERTATFVQPLAHTGDWIHLVEFAEPDIETTSPYAELLRGTVLDGTVLPDDICFAFASVASIDVLDCGDGENTAIDEDDFSSPELFDQVVQCVFDLAETGGQSMTGFGFTTVGRDGSVRTASGLAQLAGNPTQLPDGTMILADVGAPNLSGGPCDGLVQMSAGSPAAIWVWPAEAAEPVQIPVEVQPGPGPGLFHAIPAAARVESGLRVLVGGEVWEIDEVAGSAERLLESASSSGLPVTVLGVDGRSIIRLEDGAIDVIDIDTGVERNLVSQRLSDSWVEPLLLSGNLFFLDVVGRFSVLDLDGD